MPRIRAVFLDLGNVLVFHEDAILFSRLSAWGGASEADVRDRIRALWDPINRGILAGDELRRAVCRSAGSEIPLGPEAFSEMWNCHFRLNHAVFPLVERLFPQASVFLLSNTNAQHFEPLRRKMPVLDKFSGFALSYVLGLAKPEPAIFTAACSMAGVSPEEAAFFDDVPEFAQGALATGMMGRVFTDPDRFRLDLADLDLHV